MSEEGEEGEEEEGEKEEKEYLCRKLLMMRRRIAVMMATLAALVGCGAQRFTTLSPDSFQESIKDADIQLVDVRTAEEYAEQHIPGAVNIDVYADDFVNQCQDRLDKERPVAVYCRTGRRSASAAEQLRKAGFKRVLNLDGGIFGWIEAGKPVNRASE